MAEALGPVASTCGQLPLFTSLWPVGHTDVMIFSVCHDMKKRLEGIDFGFHFPDL